MITLICLYKLFQNQKHTNSKTSQTGIEHLLDAFVSEMKEDNDHLIRLLRERGTVSSQPPPDPERSVKEKEEDAGPEPAERAEDGGYVPPVETSGETYEQSLAARALFLEKEGNSVTEIAKELDRGKGEIELLLKFRR